MYTFTPSKEDKISTNERRARGDFELKIIGGNAHPILTQAICKTIGIPKTKCVVGNYVNGETRVEIKESCRGCDMYIIQPICNAEDGSANVNDHLMELMVMISAARAASAERITAVMPIYGYARQDKKDKSRAPISARLVADLLQTAGIDGSITIDLHASQIQGFFTKPMDNLYAEDYLCAHMKHAFFQKRNLKQEDIVVVSPDAGGAKRAMRVAKKLGVGCAIISKERLKANEVASMRLVGSVDGKMAILVDDMADTCGTMVLACRTVKEAGAQEVHAYVVHGVLSGPAIKRINECEALTSMVVTNTIPQCTNQQNCRKLFVVDISLILAEAIRRTHSHQSLSEMFTSPNVGPDAKLRSVPKFSLDTSPKKNGVVVPMAKPTREAPPIQEAEEEEKEEEDTLRTPEKLMQTKIMDVTPPHKRPSRQLYIQSPLRVTSKDKGKKVPPGDLEKKGGFLV